MPKKIVIQHIRKLFLYIYITSFSFRFNKVTRDPVFKRKDWPGPGDTDIIYQPNEKGLYTNGRRTTLQKNMCPKPGDKVERRDHREKD
jgi:hypothetical protein